MGLGLTGLEGRRVWRLGDLGLVLIHEYSTVLPEENGHDLVHESGTLAFVEGSRLWRREESSVSAFRDRSPLRHRDFVPVL